MRITDRKKIFQLISQGGVFDSLKSIWKDIEESSFGKTVAKTFHNLFEDSKPTSPEGLEKKEVPDESEKTKPSSNISKRKSTMKKIMEGDFEQVSYQHPIKDSWTNIGNWYLGAGPDHPNGHKGVDMAAPKGTAVYPAAKGKVSDVSFGTAKGGNAVNIEHPDGKTTYYAHLDTVNVSLGDYVGVDDVIGTVGNTGNAKGKPFHLHFGIRETSSMGSWKNPADIFSIPQYREETGKDHKTI